MRCNKCNIYLKDKWKCTVSTLMNFSGVNKRVVSSYCYRCGKILETKFEGKIIRDCMEEMA